MKWLASMMILWGYWTPRIGFTFICLFILGFTISCLSNYKSSSIKILEVVLALPCGEWQVLPCSQKKGQCWIKIIKKWIRTNKFVTRQKIINVICISCLLFSSQACGYSISALGFKITRLHRFFGYFISEPRK